ncbi:MAG: protein translocase subunit SecF [Burkholderiaceae bacterium]|nr:protein translocase subunit SecF [Burkholderiaceae bacterium]
MEFFRIRRDIPFMRHALVFNIISLLTFLAAVFFLFTRGLHLSIEFTGGTVIEVAYTQPADVAKVRATVEAMKVGDTQVQNFGSARDVLIRLPLAEGVKQSELVGRVFDALCRAEGGAIESRQGVSDKGESVSRQVCAAGAAEPLTLQRSEFVGPQVGKELAVDGAMALGFVIVGIMIYLALRFEWKFAVAAIIANLHDVIIILGFFAFFQWEFSLAVLAAVLAVLGYSVNESVVIFDRIRESFRRFRKMTPPEVIDHAITSTISRTIITHGSTQLMVLSMLIFGGPTLHYFSLALTVGILFGIYSSVFVAAAIAMWLGIKREDLVKSGSKEIDPNDPNSGAVV